VKSLKELHKEWAARRKRTARAKRVGPKFTEGTLNKFQKKRVNDLVAYGIGLTPRQAAVKLGLTYSIV
jgi:hypothetical protein